MPRLILLPDMRNAEGDPRPALVVDRIITVFATIPAALAALRAVEAGQ